MPLNYIISTGGTGGHIFPALALAQEIKEQEPMANILFVGSEYGMEKELCEKIELPFCGLPVRGFVGRGFKSISALFALLKSIIQAKKILKAHKTEVIIGFGGYASAPSLLAGQRLHIPVYIHEQNAYPGAANRFFARFAKKVFLSLPVDGNLLPKEKCLIVGNPVRQEIAALSALPVSINENTKHLLILGGSLGAKSINSIVIDMLDELFEAKIRITHQCGKADYERVAAAYAQSKYDISCLVPFIDDMTKAYTQADLVLCRAGASTLCELACVAKAIICIPFPFAAHNHQWYNSSLLEKEGACVLIEEKTVYFENKVLADKIILKKILELFNSKKERFAMAQKIRSFAHSDATHQIYNSIQSTI